ncbi:hypothetical protein DL93DRAFT_2084063 [Clavulina sp. PMI_390]|nr:hypothetical protein DL93DRAFT_2084063 [Clavulina sp. PMI_390]
MSKSASIAKVMERLTAKPLPVLPSSVRALRITMAAKNAHYGARHFVNQELPRVAYNNKSIQIDVEKKPKGPEEKWNPTMVIEHSKDGTSQTLNLDMMRSDNIVAEMLRVARGDKPSSTVSSTPPPPPSPSAEAAAPTA